jgi:hypothetical protein
MTVALLSRPRRGSKRMNFIIECYQIAHPGEGPQVSPDLVADWAMTQPELWKPIPISPRDQLRRLISRSLRETYMTDPQGREVRANHPVFEDVNTADGIKRRAKYYPLFEAPAKVARTFFSWRRKAALADVMQLNLDFESWIDNNKLGETLDRPDYNFNLDIQESKEPVIYAEDPELDDEEVDGDDEDPWVN